MTFCIMAFEQTLTDAESRPRVVTSIHSTLLVSKLRVCTSDMTQQTWHQILKILMSSGFESCASKKSFSFDDGMGSS